VLSIQKIKKYNEFVFGKSVCMRIENVFMRIESTNNINISVDRCGGG